ncbi:MAG TPA: BON domain-containing protein, partial [Nitrospirales bacterium]|nr:BON domain-containing protein [Nitrospirales bacterium]
IHVNHFSSSLSCGWHHIRPLFIMALLLAAFGCASPLGHDAEVSERNEYIAARIKVALVQEGLDAAPIDIAIRNGVVTLGGFVEKEPQRQAAEKAAINVPGVDSVLNNIQVK